MSLTAPEVKNALRGASHATWTTSWGSWRMLTPMSANIDRRRDLIAARGTRTTASPLQEILHRYVAIDRREAIEPALHHLTTRLSASVFDPLARRATLDSLTRYIASDISADRAGA